MRQIFIFMAVAVLATACSVPVAPPAGTEEPITTGVEPVSMRGITMAHNQIRAQLGLSPLHWSPQIAVYAQQWAQYLANNYGCEMEHRSHLGMDYKQYGENIYWTSPLMWSDGRRERQTIRPAEVANAWVSEVSDYDYSSNTCRQGKQCGHYTQMVWRSSKLIGCGMTYCPNQGQMWVCSYDPTGNWVGERPY